MADGKWLTGVRPEMPLVQAAHEVLHARMGAVLVHVPTSLSSAADDPEHVHQLRVTTRRADAALRIFRDCLPGRSYRKARSRLRGLRRAAGAARDWDVFLMALRARSADARREDAAGTDFLIAYSLGQRAAAQGGLEGAAAREPGAFPELIRDTLGELRAPHHLDHPRFADLARPTLADLLRQFTEAAGGDLRDYDHLHQVRIRGKRLRYAVEVLSCCFPPALRERIYPMIEEMQETLGRANDSHVAIGRLRVLREELQRWPQTWARVKEGLEGLLRFHQRRLPQERRRFVLWWGQWKEAEPEAIVASAAGA